ncbi:MAG: hypothetical protein ACOCX4_08025 [Planctomycetota bacterium]
MCAGSADWAPPPATEERADEAKMLAKSILVRGPRMEMGEVVRVQGEGGGAGGTAWVLHQGANPDEGRLPRLGAGDRLRKGDEVRTGPETSVEILLGLNARMRIDADSRVRMQELTVEETADGTITYRRIELLAGGLRARVRQNTVTPTPVLVISVAATLSVGLPRLSAPGGVDILVQANPEEIGTEVKALNGGVRVSRDSRDRLELMRGQGLSIDGRLPGFRHPRPLASSEIVAGDIIDWTRLLTRLRDAGEGGSPTAEQRDALREAVWRRLPAGLQREIRRILTAGPTDLLELREEQAALRVRLLDALNDLMRQRDLFTGVRAEMADLNEEERRLQTSLREEQLEPEEVALFNRLLLESALPGEMHALAENHQRTEAAIAALKREHAFANELTGSVRTFEPPPRDSILGGP